MFNWNVELTIISWSYLKYSKQRQFWTNEISWFAIEEWIQTEQFILKRINVE